MALEVGQQAPDFTLADEANEKVTLSELKGTPVVLVFYPFDFSGTCTAENCEIRDNFGGWQAKGAQVFGISRDSRFSHAVYKKQENFTHRLLADLKGDVARAYDCWSETLWAAERATYVIDCDGTIVFALHDGTQRRDHGAVEDYIK